MARAVYESRYAIKLQDSGFGTAEATLSDGIQSTTDGASKNRSGVLINERNDINPGVTVIDTRKTVGSASRRAGAGAEYQQGLVSAAFTMPFDVIASTAFPFLEMLFQGGRVSSGAAKKWYVPHSYTSGTVFGATAKVATIVQDLGVGNSKKVQDCITSSIEFSSEEGANFAMSAEMMAGELTTGYDPSGDDFNYVETNPISWMNAVSWIGNPDSAPIEALLPGISFTLNNNASPKYYNSRYAQKYQLGDFTGDGTLNLPWTLGVSATTFDDDAILNRFINGSVTRFIFSWGVNSGDALSNVYTLDNDNDFTIAILARPTDASVGGDDEQMTEMPFDLVEYPVVEDYSWSVTTSTVTLSGYTDLYGNVFPGDRVVFHDSTSETRFEILSVDSGSTFTIDGSGVDGQSGSTFTIYGAPVNIGINDGQTR